MIYSVVPEELAPELYDRLVEYYQDDPDVTVIVDRRKRDRRGHETPATSAGEGQKRTRRDRRRPRLPGEVPPLEPA
jgi:hypothetical protein